MSELDLVTVPDDIFELAQQRTGLTDIDSDSWREGLAIILDEVNSEPAFSRQGRSQIIDDTINALGRRLHIHNRSEERRVGKECTIQCRSRWSPYH